MMALVPLLLWADNSISYTATYDYSKLTLGTDTLGGVTYTTVSYEGLYNDGAPGAPSLPVDVIRFSVPYNAVNFSVSARLSNTTTTRIDHMVYPCQLPRMMNDTTPVVITWPDSAAYAPDPDPLHPSPRAWVVDEGFMAGENHIVTVAVLPIANYHSDNGLIRNAIKKTGTVQLSLNYDLTDSLRTHPIVRENSSLRIEGYELTRSLVVNGDDIEDNAPQTIRHLMPEHLIEDSIFNGNNPISYDFPYVIITTNNLKNSVRKIAALKRQQGYRVLVETIERLMHNPLVSRGDTIMEPDTLFVMSNDSAGVIRQYLKYAFKYLGTKYVLLAGKDVPYRSLIKDASNIWHGDWYYSELSSNWNTPIPNSIEVMPELYVGRLLALHPYEVNNYTDKLFRYELKPGKGDYSFLQRALYTEGSDFNNGLSFIKKTFTDSLGISPTYMQENVEENLPTGKDVIDSINANQYGMMFSFNHGAPSCIRTSGIRNKSTYHFLWAVDSVNVIPTSNYATESGNGLNCMQNKNYPFIYYSLSCETMPYYKLSDYDIDLNYGESFTLGKDYGGPVYMGNTTEIETFCVKDLGESFTKMIYHNQYYNLGKADAVAKSKMTLLPKRLNDIQKIIVCHNLLGDPSVELWTGFPQEFSDISVTRTNNTITVSGISDNDSTIVAYTDNSGTVLKRLITLSTTFNNVSPNGCIMLYKHNYIPYIVPLLLQNYNIAQSQYVIASDVTAGYSVDSDSGRTSGDVTVTSGVEYEIEASGTVRLEGGFNVEKGATFIVNPSCF